VNRRTLSALAFAAIACMPLSCAVGGGEGESEPAAVAQPAARLGLPPAYRVFYDELADEGDWVLIEPYGYCFRPHVNFVAWRPYEDGWWDASDAYGWVWNSNEPFGWITYHYGSWFYDNFQGWVWEPGPVWGPAWVAWASVGDEIGWAPLAPRGFTAYGDVPGGMFTFVNARELTGPGEGTEALFVKTLAEPNAPVQEIYNVGHAGGVAFNRGPDAALLARLGAGQVPRPVNVDLRRVRLPAGIADAHGESDLAARTRQATGEVTRELTAMRERGTAPPPVPGALRPTLHRQPLAPAKAAAMGANRADSRYKNGGAAADSSAHKGDRGGRSREKSDTGYGSPPDSTRR